MKEIMEHCYHDTDREGKRGMRDTCLRPNFPPQTSGTLVLNRNQGSVIYISNKKFHFYIKTFLIDKDMQNILTLAQSAKSLIFSPALKARMKLDKLANMEVVKNTYSCNLFITDLKTAVISRSSYWLWTRSKDATSTDVQTTEDLDSLLFVRKLTRKES